LRSGRGPRIADQERNKVKGPKRHKQKKKKQGKSPQGPSADTFGEKNRTPKHKIDYDLTQKREGKKGSAGDWGEKTRKNGRRTLFQGKGGEKNHSLPNATNQEGKKAIRKVSNANSKGGVNGIQVRPKKSTKYLITDMEKRWGKIQPNWTPSLFKKQRNTQSP